MTLADDARAEAERKWPVPYSTMEDLSRTRAMHRLGFELHAEFMQSRVIPDEEIEAVAKALAECISPGVPTAWRNCIALARLVLVAQREVWNGN